MRAVNNDDSGSLGKPHSCVFSNANCEFQLHSINNHENKGYPLYNPEMNGIELDKLLAVEVIACIQEENKHRWGSWRRNYVYEQVDERKHPFRG